MIKCKLDERREREKKKKKKRIFLKTQKVTIYIKAKTMQYKLIKQEILSKYA